MVVGQCRIVMVSVGLQLLQLFWVCLVGCNSIQLCAPDSSSDNLDGYLQSSVGNNKVASRWLH